MKSQLIGKSVNRKDALDKVTGRALYPGDFYQSGQLIMKVLFSEKPHAIIRSVDIASAEKLAGVLAVFTAKDVPHNEYGLMKQDQPVLCGPNSDNPYGDRVRCVGDQIAVVVAESEMLAKKAMDLIRVEYENLTVITKMDQDIKDNSLQFQT